MHRSVNQENKLKRKCVLYVYMLQQANLAIWVFVDHSKTHIGTWPSNRLQIWNRSLRICLYIFSYFLPASGHSDSFDLVQQYWLKGCRLSPRTQNAPNDSSFVRAATFHPRLIRILYRVVLYFSTIITRAIILLGVSARISTTQPLEVCQPELDKTKTPAVSTRVR